MLHFSSTPSYSSLMTSCAQLRVLWQQGQWPGLPSVVQASWHQLGLNTSTHPVVQSLYSFAQRVAQESEKLYGQQQAEPAYHNRLHTADVIASTSSLLQLLDQSKAPDAQPWLALLISSAVAHDFDHPGGVNQAPFQIEQHSWGRVAQLALNVPQPWRAHLEALVLHTDVKVVDHNHEQIQNSVFQWSLPWAQVLLNEADILISASAEFGPELGRALAQEFVDAGLPELQGVGSPAGRMGFLKQIKFSTPSAKALQMPERVQAQIAELQ